MLKNYIKTAFKVFLRRKFFTFISLFGISFTLVVLMVVTTILDHTYGPFPPEVKTDRMLKVWWVQLTNQNRSSTSSGGAGYAFLDRYVRTLPNAEEVSISSSFNQSVTSYKDGEKIKSSLKHTDGAFWKVFDFNFLEGEPFTAQDEKEANFVAVINEAARKKFFGNEPAVGKILEVDEQRFRVVGVVANVPAFRSTSFADIWVPISTSKLKDYRTASLTGRFQAMILVKKRSDIPLIKGEFYSRLSRVELPDPKQYSRIYSRIFTTFEEYSYGAFMKDDLDRESHKELMLFTIIGSMILFMLLPALNLVNINISRILERASEVGVRKAFGASSRMLIGQFVVENVLLTLVGGFIGFVFSLLVLHAISQSDWFQYARFHMNYRIFLYGLLITVFFGVFSGVYPAWRMSKFHPVEALRRKP